MLLKVLRESKLLSAAALIIAGLNLIYLIYQDFSLSTNPPTVIPNIISDPDPSFMQMKFRIALGVIVVALAVWFRTFVGLFISLLGLAWVGIEYFLWWRKSFVIVRNAEASSFSRIQHTLYLYRASWWDICVLGIAIVVFICTLIILIRLRHRLSTN